MHEENTTRNMDNWRDYFGDTRDTSSGADGAIIAAAILASGQDIVRALERIEEKLADRA